MIKSLKLMFSRAWLLTTCLVFLAVLLTIRLGFWQLDRLEQKKTFNSHIISVQAMPDLNLTENIDGINLSEMEYRPAIATGHFDFDNQVVIRNQVWVQSWGNEIGYTLLTPLLMQNGQAILVQRGWIPLNYDTPLSWRSFDQSGEILIKGIIRLPLEKGEMGGGVPDPTLISGQAGLFFWNNLNITRIQQQLPFDILPVYIQQGPVLENEDLPYKSIPVLELTDGAHLGYALQWFFYALLLLFGYPYFIRKYR
jgi:surfeit locus 1 family protein